MNFRAIQWQPALVWPWAHSMRPNAMLLADVDGDENCELVVGSVTGELAAFKFDQLAPWKSYSSLGSVAPLFIARLALLARVCTVAHLQRREASFDRCRSRALR